MVTRNLVMCVGLCLALGCGSNSSAVEPNTNEFDIDPSTQMELDDAAENGLGAEGSYDYDDQDGRLTITLTESDFGCGPTLGTIVAIVTELTATTMVWEFEGEDDAGVTWTRVDAGTSGVVGVWRTNDPNLFLILSSDGWAQLFGQDDMCDDDRPRNSNNCVELGLSGLDITIDGDLSDWDGAAGDATISDDQDDYTGGDGGADLRSLKVEYGSQALYVLMQIHGGPATSFQNGAPPNSGAYRLTVQGDNGLSLSERVMYVPELSDWATQGDSSAVTMDVGDEGIEFRIDLSAHAGPGFETIDMIMVEPIDCSGGTCESLDSMDCGYVDVPM